MDVALLCSCVAPPKGRKKMVISLTLPLSKQAASEFDKPVRWQGTCKMTGAYSQIRLGAGKQEMCNSVKLKKKKSAQTPLPLSPSPF